MHLTGPDMLCMSRGDAKHWGWRNGGVEPHGQRSSYLHDRPEGGDIPPSRTLLLHHAAHGRRPWRNGGIAKPLAHARMGATSGTLRRD